LTGPRAVDGNGSGAKNTPLIPLPNPASASIVRPLSVSPAALPGISEFHFTAPGQRIRAGAFAEYCTGALDLR
jgi:hypothetical protein